jgi:hypothetical protein
MALFSFVVRERALLVFEHLVNYLLLGKAFNLLPIADINNRNNNESKIL